MQDKFVTILGHQPNLSMAELESLYGIDALSRFGAASILDTRPDISLLGGSPKVGRLVDIFGSQNLESLLTEVVTKIAEPGKKISFGISFYDYKIKIPEINKLLIRLKKSLRHSDINLRFVPSKNLELNAAQVWHNQLDKAANIELLLVQHENKLLVARTTAVQNIDDFTKRDRQKPFRDAKVGMLPPKLARTLINLAAPAASSTLLDPFCGSGTVLMEALLNGLNVVGSDISDAMVGGAQQNLDWLDREYDVSGTSEVFTGDARDTEWSDIDTVVSETYLGPPISKLPANIKTHLAKLNGLHKEFLINLASQIKTGTKVVLALPAIYDEKSRQYQYLPLVDELEHLEYNRLDFKSAEGNLFYRRPEQIVARHIVVMLRS